MSGPVVGGTGAGRPDGRAAGVPDPILITNPFAPPVVLRGSERMAVGLARWLRAQGVEAGLAAGAARSDHYRFEGVPVTTVRAPDLGRVWRELTPELTCTVGLARHLARHRPALAHCLLYQDATAARWARIPYVITLAGMPLPRSFAGRPLNRRMFASATAGARRVTCPSAAVADHLTRHFGLAAEVVPYAVDVDALAGGRRPVPGRILCAAAPGDHRKRVHLLLAALGEVVQRHREAHVRLAGPVSEARRSELLDAVPPALRPRVAFLGDLSAAALGEEYRAAQVSCLPSLYEAFGLVVIESLAAGTPVVGSHHGALPELIGEEVGATFAADRPEELAPRLATLLERNADDSMADACRRAARRYGFDAVGPRWLELYRSVA